MKDLLAKVRTFHDLAVLTGRINHAPALRKVMGATPKELVEILLEASRQFKMHEEPRTPSMYGVQLPLASEIIGKLAAEIATLQESKDEVHCN